MKNRRYFGDNLKSEDDREDQQIEQDEVCIKKLIKRIHILIDW